MGLRVISKKLFFTAIIFVFFAANIICAGIVYNVKATTNTFYGNGTNSVSASLPSSYISDVASSCTIGCYNNGLSLYYVSDTYFAMMVRKQFNYGAADFNFSTPLSDINRVKSLTLHIQVSPNSKRNELIPDYNGDKPYYRLYPLNSDGKVNSSRYFDFNDSNVSALDTKIEVVLNHGEVASLADENGDLRGWQFNYYQFDWLDGDDMYGVFIVYSIDYELFTAADNKEVSFYDTDGTTLLKQVATPYSLECVNETFPDASVSGYPHEGYDVKWYTQPNGEGDEVDETTEFTANTALYAHYVKKTYTFYGNGTNSVSASLPTSYINDTVSAQTRALNDIGQFSFLYYIDPDRYFAMEVYAGYNYGAVDFNFSSPLTDVSKVKTLTFHIQISPNSNRDELIPDYFGKSPYYRLYPLNSDGTVNSSRYFDFNDSNVSAFDTEIEVVLNHDEIALLANENGDLCGWQFNFYQFDWASGCKYGAFIVYSIDYELLTASDYHNVNFYDVDGTTMIKQVTTPYTLKSIDETFPTASVSGYPRVGYELKWYTQPNGEGDVVEETAVFTANTNLYAHFEKIEYSISYDFNGALDTGDGDRSAPFGESVNKPTDPTIVGYSFAGWYEDGATEPFNFSSMPMRNVALVATWQPCSYDLTVDAAKGTSVEIVGDQTKVFYGSTLTFRVSVDKEYTLTDVYVEMSGEKFSPTLNNDGTYSVLCLASDAVIHTEIAKTRVAFNDLVASGGRLTCKQPIYLGESAEFIVEPAKGFRLKKWIINGTDITDQVQDNKYTVESVSEELDFEIEFEQIDGDSCSSAIDGEIYGLLALIPLVAIVFKAKKRGEN